MRRRAGGALKAEPTQLRYFIDTTVLGIIATRTHPWRAAYLSIIAAEEFDDRTPSISTIVVNMDGSSPSRMTPAREDGIPVISGLRRQSRLY